MNDLLFNIDTEGIDESKEDFHHNRYEATPYEVLDCLIESGYVSKESKIVDYGCGKGRVALYLNHQIGCDAIGVDYNDQLICIANENKKRLNSNVEFYCVNAEKYEITDEDSFYFFNPFSERILRKVINQIIISIYDNPTYSLNSLLNLLEINSSGENNVILLFFVISLKQSLNIVALE